MILTCLFMYEIGTKQSILWATCETIHKKYNRDNRGLKIEKYGFAKGYDIALMRLEKPAKMFTVREITQSRQGF